MLKAICHTRGGEWEPVADLSKLSDLREQSGRVLWIEGDVAELTHEDIDRIAEEFDLHPLAVEDAISTRQRPKLEEYKGHHLFAVLHQLESADGQLEGRQIACFIGPRYVITLHAGAERTLRESEKRWRDAPEELARGVAFLMHTLLDTLVDDYQSIADELEAEIEELEEIVLTTPGAPVDRQLYAVKQRLSRFRRYALPAAKVLDDVVQPERYALIPEATAAYFRDVYDHVLRIGDQIRNVEELANAAVDLHQSAQQQALNEVTKKLTGWAAIIAVPTFIASVYGMNFRLVPPDGKIFGFWFALGLMGASGALLYIFFRKRGWL